MSLKGKTSMISVQGVSAAIMSANQNDYISLTDMAKARTDSARAVTEAERIKELPEGGTP